MDQLRGSSVFLFAALGVVTVWAAVRMFAFEPDLPGTTAAVESQDYSTPAFDRVVSSADLESRTAAEERIRRMQAVIRSQREEIQAFRAARARETGAATVSGNAAQNRGGLFSGLPDLSALTGGAADDELSVDEMAGRLGEMRSVAIELREQLEAAESIVEMQMAEIEDLKEELDTSRERSAELAADREELDTTIIQMLNESRELETVATRVLAGMGPAAAPALLPLLEDERLYVRTWVRGLMRLIAEDRREEEPGGDRNE